MHMHCLEIGEKIVIQGVAEFNWIKIASDTIEGSTKSLEMDNAIFRCNNVVEKKKTSPTLA